MTEADRLLDKTEVSEHLGVGESTLAKWRGRGIGPPFLKIGKRIVYRMSDLEKWLDTRLKYSTRGYGQTLSP